MNIIVYLSIWGAFLGGSMLYEKQREVRALKKELQELPAEQEITQRNFRCITL